MKISFDFDNTLSLKEIQKLATFYIESGADVWILTSRFDDWAFDQTGTRYRSLNFNVELRKIASELGIPNDKILYTNGGLKKDLFLEHKFDFHYDDDKEEVDAINKVGTAFLIGYEIRYNNF